MASRAVLLGLADQQPGRTRRAVLTCARSQALGQCRRYLKERYPETEIVQVNSTAKAAQEAAQDPEGMAVCSYKCAEVYDLRVVDRDIQDAGESEFAVSGAGTTSYVANLPPLPLAANTTRFVVLSKASTTLPNAYPVSQTSSSPVEKTT